MAQPTPQIMEEAATLITQLRNSVNDEEIVEVVARLGKLLPDPYWMGYTVDHVPELSPVEVVLRAFLYKPIQL